MTSKNDWRIKIEFHVECITHFIAIKLAPTQNVASSLSPFFLYSKGSMLPGIDSARKEKTKTVKRKFNRIRFRFASSIHFFLYFRSRSRKR